MQRLGKPQIPLSFEPSGACEQDGEAPHEESGPMCPPMIRVDISRGTKVKQVILVFPTERVWQVPAAFDSRRNGDQRISRRLGQRRQRSQIARRIAFQP